MDKLGRSGVVIDPSAAVLDDITENAVNDLVQRILLLRQCGRNQNCPQDNACCDDEKDRLPWGPFLLILHHHRSSPYAVMNIAQSLKNARSFLHQKS